MRVDRRKGAGDKLVAIPEIRLEKGVGDCQLVAPIVWVGNRTVTVWDNSPTLSAMETFSAAPASSLSPVRRLVAKLGAVTSIEYVPTGRPVTENLPSVPLVVWG